MAANRVASAQPQSWWPKTPEGRNLVARAGAPPRQARRGFPLRAALLTLSAAQVRPNT